MYADIDACNPVKQLVLERPARARVFDRLGIEYTRQGDKPLTVLCSEKSLDVKSVLYDLRESDATTVDDGRDWSRVALGRLVDEIISAHNQYLRREAPAISYLLDKIADANQIEHPELVELKRIFKDLCSVMISHIDREEETLFPLCRQLDRQDSGGKPVRGRRMRYLVSSIDRDHERMGEALSQIRFLTNGFASLPDSGFPYRVLMNGLTRLESHLLEHVRLENDYLFPRALQMEAGVPAARAQAQK